MYSSPDFPVVQEVQRRLGQRLALVPTVIEVDSTGQATQRATTPRIHQGVEIPVTLSGLY